MRRERVRDDWRERLSAAGMDGPAALLDDSLERVASAGSFELLSKPGLNGRQRWRWTLEREGGGEQVVYVKRYRAPLARFLGGRASLTGRHDEHRTLYLPVELRRTVFPESLDNPKVIGPS